MGEDKYFAGKTSLARVLLDLSKDAIEEKAGAIKDKIANYKSENAHDALTQSQMLDLQHLVGEYNNLCTLAASMTRTMKESLKAAADRAS